MFLEHIPLDGAMKKNIPLPSRILYFCYAVMLFLPLLSGGGCKAGIESKITKRPQPAPPGSIEFSGIALDLQGKAVAGAQLIFSDYLDPAGSDSASPVTPGGRAASRDSAVTETDAQGRFFIYLTVGRKEVLVVESGGFVKILYLELTLSGDMMNLDPDAEVIVKKQGDHGQAGGDDGTGGSENGNSGGNGDQSDSSGSGNDQGDNDQGENDDSGNGDGCPGDRIAPWVVESLPANNAGDVDINIAVTVTFSEPVDPLTVTDRTFLIPGVTGDLTVQGNVVLFRPTMPLSHDGIYTVDLTQGIRDLAGNAMAAPFSFTFFTVPEPLPQEYPVSVTVTGLIGTLRLTNSGLDEILTFTGDGTRSFTAAVADGSPYAVKIYSMPIIQCCRVTGGGNGDGTGLVQGCGVSVLVTCKTLSAHNINECRNPAP